MTKTLCILSVKDHAHLIPADEIPPHPLPLLTLNQPTTDMKKQDATIPDDERLITKADAAKRLAISTRTLDRIVESGLIEKQFIRSSVRFKLSVIRDIVQNGI